MKKNIYKYKPVQIFNITDWNQQLWEGTLGSRAKLVVESLESKRYYFKESHHRYPWEFWCEIIASKIGQILGLDIVDYNIAKCTNDDGKQIVGSISEFINNESNNEFLAHGQTMSTAIKPDFDTKKGTDHSFQLIENALSKRHIRRTFIGDIIQTIIFDALIGNRDRHQENWALVYTFRETHNYFIKNKISESRFIWASLRWIVNTLLKIKKEKPPFEINFAPIFDNGSSLGHEIIEENLEKYLTKPDAQQRLEKYVFGKKSQSHIRWKEKKLNHFELIIKIKELYAKHTIKSIGHIVNNFEKDKIEECITNIDKYFQPNDKKFVLSDKRKEFLIKLVTLRAKKLEYLLNQWK